MSRKLTNNFKRYLKNSRSAPMAGISTVERFKHAPSGHRPTDLLPGARSVVAVLIPVPRSLLDLLGRMEKSQLYPYQHRVPNHLKEEVPNVSRARCTHVYGRCCYETHNV